MSGVMRLILERDEGSARGDEDFFSVARTIPLVAERSQSVNGSASLRPCALEWLAFDPQCCYTLVYCVQSIFYSMPSAGSLPIETDIIGR